jgi:hypothetical protein
VRVANEPVEVQFARQATQQKKKESPHRGLSFFRGLDFSLDAVSPRSEVYLSFSSHAQSGALLLRRLMRSVLVFPAMLFGMVVPVMMF